MQKCVFLYFSHTTCRNEVKSFACDCNQGFGNFISGVGNIGAMKKFDIGQKIIQLVLYFCWMLGCSDINECLLESTNDCGINTICINTVGT